MTQARVLLVLCDFKVLKLGWLIKPMQY